VTDNFRNYNLLNFITIFAAPLLTACRAGWLGFYGILSAQISAITRQKKFMFIGEANSVYKRNYSFRMNIMITMKLQAVYKFWQMVSKSTFSVSEELQGYILRIFKR